MEKIMTNGFIVIGRHINKTNIIMWVPDAKTELEAFTTASEVTKKKHVKIQYTCPYLKKMREVDVLIDDGINQAEIRSDYEELIEPHCWDLSAVPLTPKVNLNANGVI